MKKRYLLLLPAIAVLASCEPSIKDEIDSSTYSAGEANFSSYVAVGNSLTSGFMDGTVFKSGQKNSFPNILAGQFKIVGGGEFTQPSYEDDVNDVGGLLFTGAPNENFPSKLIVNMQPGADGQPLGPQNINKPVTIEASKQQKKAYHNAGVPGAKTFHLIAPGYGSLAGLTQGTANPYFVRTATSDNTTVLADAMSLKPTFFTNWIGANDVLSYATSGGEGVDQNKAGGLNPAVYGSNDITHAGVFKQVYEGITTTLTSQGAKGVVATIPDVTAIPFFTTVPYNPLSPQVIGVDNIDQLNVFVGMLKQILTAAGEGSRLELFSKTKANPLLIQDKTLKDMGPVLVQAIKGLVASGKFPLPITDAEIAFIGATYGKARHATAKDLMLLTSKSQIGLPVKTGNAAMDSFLKKGVTVPIEDKFVLNPVEQANIKEATVAFNNIIKATAASKGLAVADMNDILNKAVAGLRVEDGQIYTADYFKGMGNLNTVMFSLDGVHLNARGYAFIASEILKTINKHYKANIPLVNPAVYPGPTLVVGNK
ncbi:hypothetical protein HX017_14870 [Myroides marinus]|uniref:hypothetical protein n=1 Tax=Myroides marinus TaxID=703342 RepID=UPI002574A6F9|nr:hypothetical protein [Myroides marinus]MDM1348364.1 hypothetical protein [Myroides marinus]MDM1351881.1 hypothetical protein [Myroides marinus]MDM1355557.1 hypothetical protein [Myroides marinus]MDM1359083.1 hypothetical protein [Myroides marinus]MDM1362778.1 hypothetical protein [Myroides marinus]